MEEVEKDNTDFGMVEASIIEDGIDNSCWKEK